MSDLNARVNEILTANGLDFSILKVALGGKLDETSINADGDIVEGFREVSSPYYGLLNDKTGEFINTVKEGYAVSQNEDIVKLVLEGMDGFGELSVQKAGSLHGGRRVFIQLAINGLSVVGNDRVKRYVTVIDSNDGSSGLSVGTGDFTMSCSNQFFQFSKSGQARMRHTASLEKRMLEIPSLIKGALVESMRTHEMYQKFTTVKVSDNDVHRMVEELIGISKLSSTGVIADANATRIRNMDNLYEQMRIELAQKGKNVWGLHSGTTRWTTHEKNAPKRPNGRIEGSMIGVNYKVNQKSIEFAKELAMV